MFLPLHLCAPRRLTWYNYLRPPIFVCFSKKSSLLLLNLLTTHFIPRMECGASFLCRSPDNAALQTFLTTVPQSRHWWERVLLFALFRWLWLKLSTNPDLLCFQFSSVAQSCLTLQSHRLQHARLPYPSPIPEACSNSCPLSQWCHPTISSSVVPFSCLQSFPASGSFPMSQFLTSAVQSIGVSASASVLPIFCFREKEIG